MFSKMGVGGKISWWLINDAPADHDEVYFLTTTPRNLKNVDKKVATFLKC